MFINVHVDEGMNKYIIAWYKVVNYFAVIKKAWVFAKCMGYMFCEKNTLFQGRLLKLLLLTTIQKKCTFNFKDNIAECKACV